MRELQGAWRGRVLGAGAEKRDNSGRMGNERGGWRWAHGGVAIISIIRKYLPWSAHV